ncbi:hypothetical protein ATS71_07800 [Pseudoalteromonas sp. H71]|nr:hypothetical protein ATS71_07800 [Pseudoalteromonas sp. H71]
MAVKNLGRGFYLITKNSIYSDVISLFKANTCVYLKVLFKTQKMNENNYLSNSLVVLIILKY